MGTNLDGYGKEGLDIEEFEEEKYDKTHFMYLSKMNTKFREKV